LSAWSAGETCRNHESSGFCDAIFAVLFLSRAARLHQQNQQKEFAMSAPLVVSIPHRLGREEAVRRLKGGLERAAASVPVLTVDEERWDGDQMFFRVRAVGQAASGHINVSDDHVRLEVTLPWLLQRFAEMAQVAIRDRGKLLLTKRD
jgi:Putative polyhydroxyalkanoic acid system protein (PHA_gran_rgn)